MRILRKHLTIVAAALLAGAAALLPSTSWAGSCCGGSSPTALLVPKYARAVADLSFDAELYDGFWDQDGVHRPDPPGSDLKQYRLNLGLAGRFFRDWQASIAIPYVWNENSYSGISSSRDGLGDINVSLWYDAVDDTTAWKVRGVKDLTPAVTLGLSVLIPTGISPYDDVNSSFDITGRGFYRLDGNLLVEKTIQPWYASVAFSYGTYFARDVNRDYGKYVQPYRRQLGDRLFTSASLGYTYYLGSGGDMLTGTASYSFLNEADGTVSGMTDSSTSFQKQAVGLGLSYGGTDRDWSVRVAWNHAIQADDWGRNFPTTDIFTLGVRYVFR